VHHLLLGEQLLERLPRGAHVLIMSHDHAEDFALCDAALRCTHLGSIGLIGSAAKWTRFRAGLRVEGHDEATLGRIRCPIGLPGLPGKEPEAVAVSVAAELLQLFAADRVRSDA
jgi:xanthine dehydrogenase accessory factor